MVRSYSDGAVCVCVLMGWWQKRATLTVYSVPFLLIQMSGDSKTLLLRHTNKEQQHEETKERAREREHNRCLFGQVAALSLNHINFFRRPPMVRERSLPAYLAQNTPLRAVDPL